MVLFWGNTQTSELSEMGRYLSAECTGIGGGGCTTSSRLINFMSLSMPGGNRTSAMANTNARNNIVHEFGHAFANRFTSGSDGPYDAMNQRVNSIFWSDAGFHSSPASANRTWRQYPLSDGGSASHEAFADMFLGWTYSTWNYADELGSMRNHVMTTNMAEWLRRASGP
jgi:hypothetical protein